MASVNRYLLNGVSIPRPAGLRREFINVESELNTINGRTTKDMSQGALKERFILVYDLISGTELQDILDAIDLNTAVLFQVAENNLTINEMSVFPKIEMRRYNTPTGSYIESVELVLTQVSPT